MSVVAFESPPRVGAKLDVALRARLFQHAETRIFLAFWILLLVAGRTRLFQDPGTFWHTVVGQRMLSTQELLRADDFTFTFHSQPWIAHQWLGECLMAAVHQVGGWDGLLVCTTALLATLFAWIGARLLRAGMSGFAVAIVLGIVFLASAHHFHIRPHLASMVGMALVFGLLCDVEMGRRKPTALAWLIPLFALWSNLHGGVLGGLATVTIVVTGWIGLWCMRLASPLRTGGDVATTAAILLGCLATILFNPYGWQMLATWLSIMQMSLPGMIIEHGRPDPRRIETWALLAAGTGYLALVLRQHKKVGLAMSSSQHCGTPLRGVTHAAERRATMPKASRDRALAVTSLPSRWWTNLVTMVRAISAMRCTWLVVLVWLVLACDRVRHLPLFVLMAAIALPDLLQASRWRMWFGERGWLARVFDADKMDSPGWRVWRLPAVLTAMLLALAACGSGERWARLDAHRWPVELVDDLRAIAADPAADHRIFNALDFGGFVTFHAPQLRTFIDDRCELFGNRFLLDYFRAETEEPEQIESWREQYRFQHALVRTGSPFDQFLSSHAGWRLVRRTPAGTLYRHRDGD